MNLLLSIFFLVIVLGCWWGSQPRLHLAKSVATLLAALLVGLLVNWWFDFDQVLIEAGRQINFLKSLLFLLFMCATGYKIGPDIARMRWATAWRGVVVSLVLAGCSFLMVAVIFKLQWLDLYSLIGVTAGGVTQTSILEIAKSALKEAPTDIKDYSAIAFAITYLISTAVTIILCKWVLPRLFRRDLVLDAKNVSFTGGSAHLSSKVLLLSEPQARVYTFAGVQPMPLDEIAKALKPITVQGVCGSFVGNHESRASNELVNPGECLILLADRCQLKNLPEWIGPEEVVLSGETIRQYQYVSQSLRLRKQDECTMGEYMNRCHKIVHNLYIEQVTRNRQAVDWRNPDAPLKSGDLVKVLCSKESLQKLDGCIGEVIPKKADTDLITLGLGIALGIVIGEKSVRGLGLGTGLGVLLGGVAMGYLHEKKPKLAGFPPQAVQLFSDFGLLGFLALTGLNASKDMYPLFHEGLQSFCKLVGLYVGCGLLVTVIPFLLTSLLGFFLFGRNIAMLAFSMAGSRSATPSEQALETVCGKEASAVLAGTAFMIPYASANILLTAIGLLIAQFLA